MKDLLYQLSYITVEHKVGFEPTNKGFAVPAIRPLWYLCFDCLATMHGIEPRLTVLETAVLPLHHTVVDWELSSRTTEALSVLKF